MKNLKYNQKIILTKLETIFVIFMINIKDLLNILLMKKKNSIDCKIHKAKGINFYDRYDALYNYLDHLLKSGGEEILKKYNGF